MNQWHLHLAARALDFGGLVLHATEGIWGLACDPHDEVAVARLLTLKGRSVNKGLIVIGSDTACFRAELTDLEAPRRSQVEASWPGAVTWVVPNVQFPYWITGGRRTVAIRVPGHAQARGLSRVFGGPLVSTSANRSGRSVALNDWQARLRFGRHDFPGPLDYILPGAVCRPGEPSQIRTLAGATLRG